MTKEEARIRLEKLNKRISSHKNCIDKKEREIIELEAIINKKDDSWRDRELNGDEYVLLTKKVILMYQMHAFAHARNEGWVPDWNDGKVGKFGILYNAYDEFEVLGSFWCNYFVFGISVKSMEIAVEMFEEFGERIKEIYNIQY